MRTLSLSPEATQSVSQRQIMGQQQQQQQKQIGGWSPFLSNHNNNNNNNNNKKTITTRIKGAVAVSNAQTRDRIKLKQLFQDANQRCRTSPYEGVSFTLDDFLTSIHKYDYNSPKVKGSVDGNGHLTIKHDDDDDDTLIQYDLAWEQLQAEDVVITAKKSSAEELLDKNLPFKFVEVDEEQSILVLSNRKAMPDSHPHLGIGSVVTGTVQSLKPYGAFIHIAGINGLLHVSQISHHRVSDIASVLQPGHTLKVMILSHDRERGRVSLSTKKLEPTPGDMIRNPNLVFDKAEEMAQTFRQRIAQAEAMARALRLRGERPPKSTSGLHR